MNNENEYTDSDGVRYVAANPLDDSSPCRGCALHDKLRSYK